MILLPVSDIDSAFVAPELKLIGALAYVQFCLAVRIGAGVKWAEPDFDIRERRLGLLRAGLREALVAGGFDRYRAVVEPLADEFDLAKQMDPSTYEMQRTRLTELFLTRTRDEWNEILEHSDDTEWAPEGCLSIGEINVEVPRYTWIKLRAQDLNGTEFEAVIEDFAARVVQHEVDHLDGVLILDRATPEDRRAALAELRLTLLETPPAKSNAAAQGLIGAQSPPPGEKVARDSAIAYSISLGPDLVALPNIIGNNFSIVEPRLVEAGFVVGNVTGRQQNKLRKALVGGQEVGNGDELPRGATIDLVFP